MTKDEDRGNVIELRIGKRNPNEAPQFDIKRHSRCGHYCGSVTYEVDLHARTVSCSCGAALDPFFVLEQMSRSDSRYMANKLRAAEANAALDKRTRTKCQHCGHMTRIKGIL